MPIPRPGLIDLGIATVIVVAIALPAREMLAMPVVAGDDAQQFQLAQAEAKTIAKPGDGLAVEDFARRLGEAGMKDWAIEVAVHASDRDKDAPTRWRSLLAASVAYVDELDVVPALDFANRALAACETARERGDVTACPSGDEIRMHLYQQSLDAGVKSGIDPRHDPAGFRRAGESALRQIRLKGPPVGSPERAGSAGSGASRP